MSDHLPDCSYDTVVTAPGRAEKAVKDNEQEFLERLEVTACRSGCPTQDHATYGECLKAARFGVAAGETSRGQY